MSKRQEAEERPAAMARVNATAKNQQDKNE
jgi:hypothetical protein